MGRRKVIDRESVLDCAERVVAELGATGLTIDAVAKAAGITKGGVQSCFGSKEAMIAAMLSRWSEDYARRAARLSEADSTPAARVRSHIDITAEDEANTNSRSATLLSALLQSPEYLSDVRKWYADRLRDCRECEAGERERALLAFLATEGLFFIRYLHLADVSQREWEGSFALVRQLLSDQK